MKQRIQEWVEHRTGLETMLRHFLYEEIPASSGWHQVFGSMALFLFMLQAFTGILLSFNYAPTPGEAYNSLKFVIMELTGGRLIRGLHHWGASMMIVVVAAHMVQVFLYGAYKKPREATWMVGVVLLLMVLGFGLTGYLLPWDNRAYWGTVVATQLAAKTPLLGPYLTRLAGAENGIGVLTFARFYSLHVLLLPAATVGLTMLHIYLVRKHGVAPLAGDTAPKKRFYPEQVMKDTVAIFAAFVVLFLMAALVHVPLGRLADPTDTAYIPRPDWYFLFLFQMLKMFEGPLELIGSTILPALTMLALFLVPFFDHGRVVRVAQRTAAMGVLALAVIAWTGLTVAAVRSTPKSADMLADDVTLQQAWQHLPPEDLAAIGSFRKANCETCHLVGEGKPKAGPSLAVASQKPVAWLAAHVAQPSGAQPVASTGNAPLTGRETTGLVTFLARLDAARVEALQGAPGFAAEGASVYQKYSCGACHEANGVGKKLGPVLNGLVGRRTRDWVERHFAEPQALSPGTTMPAYKFSPRELDRITGYLFSLVD